MPNSQRKFAIVTGASTGIGLELARECAKNGFDLLIAANEPEINNAADSLRREGGTVEALQADLATPEGVDQPNMRPSSSHPDFCCRTRQTTRTGLRTCLSGSLRQPAKPPTTYKSYSPAGRVMLTSGIIKH